MTLGMPVGICIAAAVLAAGAPALGSTSLAIVGDPGYGGAGEASVATMVGGWNPDAVVLMGDNYYTAGLGPASGPAAYDTSVGRYYCPFLKGAFSGAYCAGGTSSVNRLWPILGNHDYSDGGIANYLSYFSLPGTERYYDQRIGPVHLFVLDSDEMLRSSSELATEQAWLKAGLAASTAPFQVVALHHPAYTSSARGPYSPLRWDYKEWGADLVLNGHDHFYERLSSGGLTYVVNGIGGASLSAWPSPGVSQSVAHYSGTFGAMRITATDTELVNEFVTTDGVVRDRFTVSAPQGGNAGSGEVTDPGATPEQAATLGPQGRASSVRLRRAASGRVHTDVVVALSGTAAAGARVRVAVAVSRGRAMLSRGTRVVTLGAAPTTHITVRVPLGTGASRIATGQVARVRSVVAVTPIGGEAITSTTSRNLRLGSVSSR